MRMKKINYLLLGAAGLVLASCSQDDLSNANGNADGNLTVTVKLPNIIKSRAVDDFGLGYQALKLNYAVYDNGTLVLSNIAEFPADNLETTLNLNLAKGKNYNIAFFAQSQASMNSAAPTEESNAVYTFDAEEQTVTVNYENMTSANNLNDAYDCFYGVIETGKIEGATTISAELFRPVGQVNWGTSDLTDEDGNDSALAHQAAYGTQGQYIQTNLKVVKPYNTLNLLSGETTQVYDDSDTEEVIIEAMAAPYTFTFPVDEEYADPSDYVYVAMTYLLAPSADPTLYDLNLNIDNGNEPNVGESATGEVNTEVEVSAAPVQANYQTNIYGNLLSSNVIVNVRKNPEWKGSYNMELGISEPETNEDGAYLITGAPELRWIAAQVNSGENNFAGKTLLLENDLDLSGEWTPIGVNGNPFRGFFDGQNHTISNLTISSGNYVGLFGNTNYANQNGGQMSSISNLTINNANVTGRLGVAAVVGHPYGTNFENIKITGLVQISGAFYVGTVAGGNMVYGNFTDITVDVEEGSYVSGDESLAEYGYGLYIAGIVGHPAENNKYTNLKSNIDVKATGCEYIGGIAGLAHYGSTWTNCSCSANVSLTNALSPAEGTQVGGITGSWMNDSRGTVTFTGCSFTGTLSSEPITEGYDLATLNAITGTSYNEATTPGVLYIDGSENVADQHYLPDN